MLDKVKKTIADNNMLSADDKVLVALSGGCDSVCLCLVLKFLKVDFAVAHVNHMIRANALRDENFCKDFAKKIGADFYLKTVDIPSIAKKQGISEELAGRNARYEFFDELCKENGFTKIAVAHNLNDNAETVLMNLIRGSGLKGLTGIPKTRNNIIRPLIDVSRQEIEEFAANYGESYVTDETNFSEDYTRNKIRNSVIPELMEISNAALSNISRTTEILTRDDAFLESQAKKYVFFENEFSYIEKEDFEKLDCALKARALLLAYSYAAGTSKDFEKKHIDYITENFSVKANGIIIELCFDVVCRAEYGKIIFEKKKDDSFYSYTLPLNGEIYVKEAGINFVSKIILKEEIHLYENAEFFDMENPTDIVIRSRKKGDTIIPFGKNSEVKVKDILIKDKVPHNIRKKLPVIECGDVLWLYGVRRSNLYKICEKTNKVLMIKGEKQDA